MKALIIEDDPTVAEHIRSGLESAGHECFHQSDGKNGLNRALDEHFDLVILDIMLPEMDGFTVLEEIRAVHPALPVLLLSAKSQVDDKVRGLRSGANDYLTKPFDIPVFLEKLRALARRRKKIRSDSELSLWKARERDDINFQCQIRIVLVSS